MFTDRKHNIIDNKIRRILIAEDEFINRELLSNILKNDFEIITADNKAEQANHAKQLGKFSVLCYKPYTNCILQTKNRRTFYEQENFGAGSEPCYVLRYSNNRLQRFRLELQEL